VPIEEPDAPTHRVSSDEDRAQILAEALAHAEAQEAQYRLPLSDARPPGRWKSLLATVTFVLAGVIAAAPPSWLLADPPAPVTAGERLRGTRATLFLQAQQIEAYRMQNQRLPRSLEELPMRVPGVRFVRSNNRVYQLVAFTRNGETTVYDSTRPEEFELVAAGWIREEGS